MRHALTLLCLLSSPALAQDQALVFFAHAGRATSLMALKDGDEFAPALAIGGGAAIQVSPSAAVRAGFTRVSTAFRGAGTGFTTLGTQRDYLAVDVQTGWPGSSLVPYLLVGVGGVRTDPAESGAATETHLGGRGGGGFNIVGDRMAFFVEATAWVYAFRAYGFDRTQLDLTVQAGVALAVPF